MYTVVIDNTLIPDGDIIDIDIPTKDTVNTEFKLESASINITLNNVDPDLYDPDNTASMFYTEWYNMSVVVTDQDTDLVIFRGKIKERSKQKATSKNIVKIKVDNNLKDILKCKVNQGYGVSSNATPSDIIYGILTDICDVPVDQINLLSFQIADDYQTANSAYLYVNYSSNNSSDAGEVINMIMKLTNSYLYMVNNIFHYMQWKPYTTTDQGVLIRIENIINGTYVRGSEDKTIYNDYRLVYNSSGTASTVNTTAAGHDITSAERVYLIASIATYGRQIFQSHDDTESTTSADYQVIYKTKAAAQFYGRLLFQRFYTVIETVQFSLTAGQYNRDSIGMLQQLDLTYQDYSREPLRIYSIEYKKKDKSINVYSHFINLPAIPGTTARDKTPPDAVELYYAYVSGQGEVVLSWSVSPDTGLSHYHLYISRDNIEWFKIYPGIGMSPIAVTTYTTEAGACFYTLDSLDDDQMYYFKVSALDTALNESVLSNTVSVYLYNINFSIENMYRTDGDLYNGIIPIIDNTNNGTLVAGYTHYDDLNYDEGYYEISAVYESFIMYSLTGFESMVFQGVGEPGDITIYWRSYSGGSFSAWSTDIDGLSGIVRIEMSGAQHIQLRYIYNNTSWTTDDNLKIIQINEL